MSKYGSRDNKIVSEKITTDDLEAAAQTIGTTEIEDAAITIAKQEAALKKDQVSIGPLDVSATTVWYLEFPVKVDIDKVVAVVSTVLDATCNVQAKNAAGTAMTDGSVNLDVLTVGTTKSCSPSANNEIAADASMQIVSDGVPGSGAIYAVVHYTRKA